MRSEKWEVGSEELEISDRKIENIVEFMGIFVFQEGILRIL